MLYALCKEVGASLAQIVQHVREQMSKHESWMRRASSDKVYDAAKAERRYWEGYYHGLCKAVEVMNAQIAKEEAQAHGYSYSRIEIEQGRVGPAGKRDPHLQ